MVLALGSMCSGFRGFGILEFGFVGAEACVEGVLRFGHALQNQKFQASGFRLVQLAFEDSGLRSACFCGVGGCPNRAISKTPSVPADRGTGRKATTLCLGRLAGR